jgi:hypothetical protein
MSKRDRVTSTKVAAPEAKLKEEMESFDEEAYEAQVHYRVPDEVADENREQNRAERGPPAKLTVPNKAADRFRLRSQLSKQAPGLQQFATDGDLAAIDHARKNKNYANYLQFAETFFDMRNPAIAAFAEKVVPDYFERRKQQIDEVADLQKRVANLRLLGVRTPEDMKLYYMVTSGQVKLPKGPIYDWKQWYSDSDKSDSFNRGMFNYKRVLSKGNRAKEADDRYDWANGMLGASASAKPNNALFGGLQNYGTATNDLRQEPGVDFNKWGVYGPGAGPNAGA